MSLAAASPRLRVDRAAALHVRRAGLAAAGFAVWLGTWQWLTILGPLGDTAGLPSATETLTAALRLGSDAALWSSIGETLGMVGIALAIATFIGIVLGVATGSSAVLQALFDPLSQFLRPIPAVVWLPLLLLIFGPTPRLAIAMGVLGGVWPVLIQAQVGVRDVDPVILETGRAMCLSRRLTHTAIVLPSAIPYFATGVRIAAAFILMLVIGAGMLGGASGLGQLILVAQQTGEASRVFGLVIWAGVLGVAFNSVLTGMEGVVGRHWGGRR